MLGLAFWGQIFQCNQATIQNGCKHLNANSNNNNNNETENAYFTDDLYSLLLYGSIHLSTTTTRLIMNSVSIHLLSTISITLSTTLSSVEAATTAVL